MITVTGITTTQKSQNLESICSSSLLTSSTYWNSDVKKGPEKIAAMVFMGRNTIVTTAISVMSFESTFTVRESLCVTRLNARFMRLVMRRSRLFSRLRVLLTAERWYENNSSSVVRPGVDGFCEDMCFRCSMISINDAVDSSK